MKFEKIHKNSRKFMKINENRENSQKYFHESRHCCIGSNFYTNPNPIRSDDAIIPLKSVNSSKFVRFLNVYVYVVTSRRINDKNFHMYNKCELLENSRL